MANDFTGNPYIIDTVTAVTLTSAVFDVFLIRWTSASVADLCQVENEDGKDKWSSEGQAAGHTDQSPFQPPLKFNGLKVTALTSGRVHIYINKFLK